MWDWLIWGALILTALAGIAALVLLAVRTRQAWRDAKHVRQNLVGPRDEFAAKAEATAERLSTAGDTAELQESVARLRASLARLEVLTAALDEAQVSFGRVAAFLPRK
jgi:site-specific recombinase